VALKVEFHNYVDEHDYLIDGEDIEIMPPGHLKAYGVTRKLLRQIFKKAAPMMEGQDPEHVRVCADMGMDGTFHLMLCGYSEFSKPATNIIRPAEWIGSGKPKNLPNPGRRVVVGLDPPPPRKKARS